MSGRSTPGVSRFLRFALASLLPAALVACGHGNDGAPQAEAGLPDGGMPRAALLKPTVCGSCHAQHYSDWAGSMHAFAADDPVFLAMNARGQRETDGGLGTFCVNCHAPMAVRDGKTTDGLNLASLPPEYHGVTCFFCHSIASVDGTHNAAVTVASDLVMRGEYEKPVANSAHNAAYSLLQDVTQPQSAAMCGACHDIVVPPALDDDAGAHIERTFAEWQGSAFASSADAAYAGLETCGTSGCHMVQSQSLVAIAQQTGFGNAAPPANRYFHAHDFPAVDVPLPGPDAGPSDAGVPIPQGVTNLLADALQGDLCVTQLGGILVILDAFNVGHDFPSGAAQDRRLWVEIVASRGGSVVYQTGVVPYGTPAFDAGADPDLWLMRDCIFDGQGKEVHMFWQAASTDGNELTPLLSFDLSAPVTPGPKLQFFPRDMSPVPGGPPDRVTLNVWVQAVGPDVLADLVDSGDLDPAVAASVPMLPVPLGMQTGPQLVWTAAAAADAGANFRFTPGGGTSSTCVGTLPGPAPINAPRHTMCSP